jgi:hypothetical protein
VYIYVRWQDPEDGQKENSKGYNKSPNFDRYTWVFKPKTNKDTLPVTVMK